MDDLEVRANALAFLQRNRTGMLATAGEDNVLHASTVHYYADDEFNLYFFTLPSSRKYAAIRAHPQVAFTAMRDDVPQTIQIEGVAKDISDDPEMQDKKEKILEVYNANPYFFAPITKLDPEKTAVIWIRPTWIRYADYAFAGRGSERILKEIPVK